MCCFGCVPSLGEQFLALLIWGPPLLIVLHVSAWFVVELADLVASLRGMLTVESPDVSRG